MMIHGPAFSHKQAGSGSHDRHTQPSNLASMRAQGLDLDWWFGSAGDLILSAGEAAEAAH